MVTQFGMSALKSVSVYHLALTLEFIPTKTAD